jgi:hypothetical protein
MKFRFYITDTADGSIRGTNDELIARDYAESEDNFVVDTETGMWLQPDDGQEEVKEADDNRIEDDGSDEGIE